MRSKTHYKHRHISRKKTYIGGHNCTKYPNVWSYETKCFKKCPANTFGSFDIENNKFICRSIKTNKKSILTKIINNKLPGNVSLYKSDGFIFENYDTDIHNNKIKNNFLYYGKIAYNSKNKKIYKLGLGLLIDLDYDYVYYGNFQNDYKNGQGIQTYPDGSYYEGEWQLDHINGNGKIIYPENGEYHGEFEDGKFHGRGYYIAKDGSKYIGQWENHKKHGFGTMTYSDKSFYEGAWQNNHKHGKGILISDDGTKYNGDWQYDKRHGEGKLFSPDGSKYTGEFKDGKKNGEGTYIWPDGSIYVGEWKNNYMDGVGEITFNSQKKFMGFFKDGKRHGYGKTIYSNGEYEVSFWKNGVMDGLYEYHYKEEAILSGTIINGMKQGEFIKRFSNGDIQRLYFINNDIYKLNQDINKYQIEHLSHVLETKYITILIQLHGLDIINSICSLNKSKHIRYITPVQCGMVNLLYTKWPIIPFNIAYNVSNLAINTHASTSQKMQKILDFFNEDTSNSYETYNRPIIDHEYYVDYNQSSDFDFSRIYLVDTNYNPSQLFTSKIFSSITNKTDIIKQISEINEYDILPSIKPFLKQDCQNENFSFLRSNLINILLDLGYDTINIIDLSCRTIDEKIINSDENMTHNKNYQCEYKMNEDETLYLGDEVKSFHV